MEGMASIYLNLVGKVILSRLIILSLMCLSYAMLPDFHPGDDVLRFDLRIVPKSAWSMHKISCWKDHFWRNILQHIERLPKYFDVHDFEIHLLHRIDSSCAHFIAIEDNDKDYNDLPHPIHTCFCLAGHICDEEFTKKKQCHLSKTYSSGYNENQAMKCAIPSTANDKTNFTQIKRIALLDLFYDWILTPVTRWDAARFLYLAIDPCARYPYRYFSSLDDTTTNDSNPFSESKRTCYDDLDTDKNVSNCVSMMEEDQLAITNAEQAHAFYPLMPFIIRKLSLITYSYIPSRYLPPTFEGIITLVGLLWSWFMLCVAALSLHYLTYTILSFGYIFNKQQNYEKYETTDNIINEKNHNHHVHKAQQSSHPCQNNESDLHERMMVVANHVTMLFLYSPSAIFFSVPYTESTFSAFVFLGYCVALQSLKSKNHFHSVISALVWMLACGTRSNGVILIIHVLSTTIGTMFVSTINIFHHLIKIKWHVNLRDCISIFYTIMIPYVGMICCLLLSLPSILHDYYGYRQFFDISSQESIPPLTGISDITTKISSSISFLPSWLQDITHLKTYNPFSFSLYKHIQLKHWNVGFLHYYQVKNIPNFILATPSVVIAIYGVYHWFCKSWRDFSTIEDIESNDVDEISINSLHSDHGGKDSENKTNSGKTSPYSSIEDQITKKIKYFTTIRYHHHAQNESWFQCLHTLLRNWETWEVYALLQLGRKHSMTSISKTDKPSIEQFLLGPLTLPFYAVLAAITVVGVTVAHVEVSTRLICSTCPAFYWFCSFLCMKEMDSTELNMTRTNHLYHLFYLYSMCGIILFPNWLRWT